MIFNVPRQTAQASFDTLEPFTLAAGQGGCHGPVACTTHTNTHRLTVHDLQDHDLYCSLRGQLTFAYTTTIVINVHNVHHNYHFQTGVVTHSSPRSG